MEIFDYIMAILLLLFLVLVIIKFRNIRKAKNKVIITRLDKKRAVIVVLGLLFMIALFVLSSVLFDEADVTGFLEVFYCILIVLEANFGCVTPDGIIGEDIKNNGLIPKEKCSYRYTFKGMFQTEQLEIWTENAKKPNIYRGNIRNPELVKMLEENYKEYVEDDAECV